MQASVLALSLLVSGAWAGAASPPGACFRRWEPTVRRILPGTTAAWCGAEVVVPSPQSGELLVIAFPGGAARATVRGVRVALLEAPLEVRNAGGRLWALAFGVDQRMGLHALDASLRATSSRPLTDVDAGGGLTLKGALAALPIGPDLYGLVFAWQDGKRAFEGLGHLKGGPSPAFSPILPLAVGEPGRGLGEVYPSVFAEVGGHAYVLLYADPPAL